MIRALYWARIFFVVKKIKKNFKNGNIHHYCASFIGKERSSVKIW